MPKKTESAAKPAAAVSRAKTRQPKTRVARIRKTAHQHVSSTQRHDMIAEAAYLLAEQDGFNPHHVLDHWLAAEASINARFVDQATT